VHGGLYLFFSVSGGRRAIGIIPQSGQRRDFRNFFKDFDWENDIVQSTSCDQSDVNMSERSRDNVVGDDGEENCLVVICEDVRGDICDGGDNDPCDEVSEEENS